MGVRGMIMAPLISILLGYAINNFPTKLVTEIPFIKEDRFGLRSAVQDAAEHVQGCISSVVDRAILVKNAAVYRITGTSPPNAKPESGAKEKTTWKGEEKKKKGKKDKRFDGEKPSGTVTRLFTPEELQEHDGSSQGLPVYLSLLGRVFDVTAGRKHYGPGGGYAFFSGKDASRAYVSGDFTAKGLVDEISGLSAQDYIGLEDWLQFYKNDYREVGRLIGRFYDENGKETEYWNQWQKWLAAAHQEKRRDNADKEIFPPCNSEWREKTGGRVYCTPRSGGVARSWAGVPREYFSQGKKRCACVRSRGAPSHGADPGTDRGDLDHPQLQEYPGCAPRAEECRLQK